MACGRQASRPTLTLLGSACCAPGMGAVGKPTRAQANILGDKAHWNRKP